MKKKTFIGSLLLTTVLVGLTGIDVSAEQKPDTTADLQSAPFGTPIVVDKNKERELNRELHTAGYPIEEITTMPFDLKKHLVDQGVVGYLGTEKKEFYYAADGRLKEKKPTDGIGTEGTISTTAMTLSITTSQLATKSDNKKRFTVTQKWEWTKASGYFGDTDYNLVDKIGLSYNSDFDTDPYTNGGYACSHSGEYTLTGNKYCLDNCGGRPYDLNTGGAGWNVDILFDYRDYGWASMNVIAKTANTNWNQSTSFRTKYGHDTSVYGSLGLSIGYISLTISSNGGSWDEASVLRSIWY